MNVVMPEIGEDIKEATVSFWHFEEGENVNEGDDLVEMVTDKATFNVPAPASGALKEIMFGEGETVKIGEIIATIEMEGE
jgi:pyruvate/2-oxoglutarate dehydrogenase complex dihydrolipoamide acyltransferase (E2) component